MAKRLAWFLLGLVCVSAALLLGGCEKEEGATYTVPAGIDHVVVRGDLSCSTFDEMFNRYAMQTGHKVSDFSKVEVRYSAHGCFRYAVLWVK